MTVGSLFAGIGGFDLGFERAGFQIRWQVEIDAYCRQVLAKHWPTVERFTDVRACGRHNLATVDVLCGGFPCQPHSQVGRRQGSADERDLWPEFARLIRELEPRWVVAENVPGLLSTEAGRFFGAILGDLAACGYDAEWDCLSASAFGAPHRRDRVWIVAYPQIGRMEEQRLSAEGRGCLADVDRSRSLVADAECERWHGRANASPGRLGSAEGADRFELRRQASATLADTDQHHGLWWSGDVQVGRIWGAGQTPRYDDGAGTQWGVEPNVGRVAHGVPARVDRLRGLGNAIVPQIAQWIAERIISMEPK